MKLTTKYKSNNNVVYSCKYHVIWCSKYRRKVLVGDVAKRLKDLVYQVSSDLNVDIIEVKTDKDHIHILVEVDPQFGVNKFIKMAKGRTSRILRHEFSHLVSRLPTLWTNSYFVSTVGGAPLSVIKQYIENQPLSESEKSKSRWNTFLNQSKVKVNAK